MSGREELGVRGLNVYYLFDHVVLAFKRLSAKLSAMCAGRYIRARPPAIKLVKTPLPIFPQLRSSLVNRGIQNGIQKLTATFQEKVCVRSEKEKAKPQSTSYPMPPVRPKLTL